MINSKINKTNSLKDFKDRHKKYLTNDYVFKKCCDVSVKSKDTSRKWLVILQKTDKTITNESRNNVFNYDYATFRGNDFRVIKIINVNNPRLIKKKIINSYDGNKLEYKVGEIAKVNDYDTVLNNVDSSGIHYYKNFESAYFYRGIPKNFTGTYLFWYIGGEKYRECEYANGVLNGKFIEWYQNGKKYRECEYANGVLNGKFISWYDNGQKKEECEYLNSKINGKYNSWDYNGRKGEVYEYVNGNLNGKYHLWFGFGQKGF